jgi:hypothetical protein
MTGEGVNDGFGVAVITDVGVQVGVGVYVAVAVSTRVGVELAAGTVVSVGGRGVSVIRGKATVGKGVLAGKLAITTTDVSVAVGMPSAPWQADNATSTHTPIIIRNTLLCMGVDVVLIFKCR